MYFVKDQSVGWPSGIAFATPTTTATTTATTTTTTTIAATSSTTTPPTTATTASTFDTTADATSTPATTATATGVTTTASTNVSCIIWRGICALISFEGRFFKKTDTGLKESLKKESIASYDPSAGKGSGDGKVKVDKTYRDPGNDGVLAPISV